MEVLKLKKSNCKNCYKCIRNCPVKSIRFSGNQANIADNECILCGQCLVVCPQGAKEIADEIEKTKVLISGGDPVIVSLAPSFVANYEGTGIEEMEKALKKLGFTAAEETALGATMVKTRYEKLLSEDKRKVLISSCCHSINLLIQKHFPGALEYLADVLSPMQAHCLDIKKRYPGAKTVFIGPCVAKKDEADYYKGYVDAALTFEELTNWFNSEGIVLEKKSDENNKSRARFFPTTGGVLKTMAQDMPGYSYIAIDGVENCMEALRDIESGKLNDCFIEMSACVGSCIGGLAQGKNRRSPIKDYIAVSSYAGNEDFEVNIPGNEELKKRIEYIDKKLRIPSESEIMTTLRQMGKTKKEDELNCGSCGYNTCREKAVAILQGKADVSMCLPFLKEKAETFSDNIINNTPNGIVVLNEDLEVQQINRAALDIMNIRSSRDVLGEQVIRILDPKIFLDAQQSRNNIHNRKVYLAEYKKYVDQTVLIDKEYNILICILRDITDEESSREKKEAVGNQTIEIADKVIEKQMRIVQDIASLLGETAAETKIALVKLKEIIQNE